MIWLPGTGLGGLFYALLVLWMAVREGWLTLLGASGRQRWVKIGSLWAVLGSILLALWLEGWAISALLEAMPDSGQTLAAAGGAAGHTAVLANGVAAPPGEIGLDAAQALVPAFAAAPFIVLGLLLAALHAARLVYRKPIVESAPLPAIRQRSIRALEAPRRVPVVRSSAEEMELDAAE